MQESEQHKLPVLAIDLGGTKMLMAIISDNGRVMAQELCPTLAAEGAQSVLDRLFSAIDRLFKLNNMEPSRLYAISIAAAGAVDSDRGLITLSPNLPGWDNIPLRDMVQEKYQVDTFLVNDASAAALGEHRLGAGRGVKNLVLVTVGTGIGGGIIISGELYLGACGSAGEIGHMTIDVNGPECSCGNTGCLEMLASGTAVTREAVRRISSGENSSLVEIAGGEIENITAEKVGDAAHAGDPLSSDVIARAANYLGVGLVNLVNIFNPEMIVIGGGMARMGDLLLEPARGAVSERAFPVSAQAVRIVTAQLGNDAGVHGAAIFAFQRKVEGAK